jgi:hypothetical protein
MIDLETSVQQFLALGRDVQRGGNNAEEALGRLVHWYCSTRIDGAELDDDGDMLLLQWGSMQPWSFTEPTDLRQVERHEPAWEQTNYLFIDLTRQVFANPPGSKKEFDDAAVQMGMTFYYQPGAPEVQGSNIWIPTPTEAPAQLASFRAVPFVSSWLTEPPVRTVVTVSPCG